MASDDNLALYSESMAHDQYGEAFLRGHVPRARDVAVLCGIHKVLSRRVVRVKANYWSPVLNSSCTSSEKQAASLIRSTACDACLIRHESFLRSSIHAQLSPSLILSMTPILAEAEDLASLASMVSKKGTASKLYERL